MYYIKADMGTTHPPTPLTQLQHLLATEEFSLSK